MTKTTICTVCGIPVIGLGTLYVPGIPYRCDQCLHMAAPGAGRLQRFTAMATHPWFGRMYAKLSQADLVTCRAFLRATDDMDQGRYEHEVARLWLDVPNKPKHHREMAELLLCSNVGDDDEKAD